MRFFHRIWALLIDAFRAMSLLLEVDFLVGKKQLKQILEKVINTHGATKTAEVLDNIKAMGYKYLYKSSHDRIHF